MGLSPNGALGVGKPDYGTPAHVVAGVRALLGGIDLDPATTATRNETIGAVNIIAPPDNGRALPWHGRVFLNPPGGVGENGTKAWWIKLCEEYAAGRVTSAVFLAFSLDALQWSIGCPVAMLDFPVWIPAKRIAFLDHSTGEPIKSPPKPSAIVWLADYWDDPPSARRARLTEAFGERLPGYGVIP